MGVVADGLAQHGLRVTYAAHDLENTRRDLIALREADPDRPSLLAPSE